MVVGETGSGFTRDDDIAFMLDMATYLHNIGGHRPPAGGMLCGPLTPACPRLAEPGCCAGPAEDGRHSRIGSWFWWAWNANAELDTGLVRPDLGATGRQTGWQVHAPAVRSTVGCGGAAGWRPMAPWPTEAALHAQGTARAEAGGWQVEENWQDIKWESISFLEYMGLQPWYAQPTQGQQVPGLQGTLTDVGLDPLPVITKPGAPPLLLLLRLA